MSVKQRRVHSAIFHLPILNPFTRNALKPIVTSTGAQQRLNTRLIIMDYVIQIALWRVVITFSIIGVCMVNFNLLSPNACKNNLILAAECFWQFDCPSLHPCIDGKCQGTFKWIRHDILKFFALKIVIYMPYFIENPSTSLYRTCEMYLWK